MITKPMDVQTDFPVRRSAKQKTAYLTAVTAYAQSLRYCVIAEKGTWGTQNLVIGDALNARYLVTARNCDTSAVVALLQVMASMPQNLRNRVCFVLFDRNIFGQGGSSSYRKANNTAIEHQIVLCLDRVGDGDVIQFAPVNRVKDDEKMLRKFSVICGKVGKKSVILGNKGFVAGSFDHKKFPNGVDITALHYKKGIGLYHRPIHTLRDTVLDQTNINILRAAIISLIGAADK